MNSTLPRSDLKALWHRWNRWIPIGLWLILGLSWIGRSPDGAYSHDYVGHVEYTQILVKEHRLPRPLEKWETHQPPLYYLINTLIVPHSPKHPYGVRVLSVVYGAAFLGCIGFLLRQRDVTRILHWVILLFIATTPKFLFIFSTYNNDSLAMLLCAVLLVCSLGWLKTGRRRHALGIGLSATAGLYVKYTAGFAIAAVFVLAAWLWWMHRIPRKRALGLLAMLSLAAVLLLPWLIFHNYPATRQLLPHPAPNGFGPPLDLSKGAWSAILTPPGFTHGEWDDPYTHQWETVRHKKGSYLAYLLSSSIFGEYTFDDPAPLMWLIFWSHVCFYLAGLFLAFRSRAGKLALGCIVLGVVSLTSHIFHTPAAPAMDFRFISWTWLPWAVLYAEALGHSRSLIPRVSASPLVLAGLAGIAAQTYLLVHLR